MNEWPLNYGQLLSEIIEKLNGEKYIVLATCTENNVSVRTMSHVNIGTDLYMQTDSRFVKVSQLTANANVALCVGNMQLEGTADLLGHPLDDSNKEFAQLFQQKHNNSFALYSSLEHEIVICVLTVRAILWKYINGRPCRDYLDLENGTAYREYYL